MWTCGLIECSCGTTLGLMQRSQVNECTNGEVKRQTEGMMEKFILEVCNALGLLDGTVG